MVINMAIVLIFYHDPEQKPVMDSFSQSVKKVFVNIYLALKDLKFTVFLLIIVGGWTVYWQFFYSLPVYIEQWTDTGVIYRSLHGIIPGFADAIANGDGQILAEKLIALDALFIVLFQVLLSSLVIRFRVAGIDLDRFLVGFKRWLILAAFLLGES
jgi:hypothetical protein